MPPGPLRLRRLALGLRQADVAELSGVSREQVLRLEAGTCLPSWPTAVKLAAALGTDPAAIFPLNEERPAVTPGASQDSAVQRPTHAP